MFQNWLHHLKCFILILMNCAFNWVEKEKDGKRKIENGKIGFFLSLVWWKIGWVNFFRVQKPSSQIWRKSGQKIIGKDGKKENSLFF